MCASSTNKCYRGIRGEDLITKLNLQTTKQRQNYRKMCLIFKCIHGLVPEYLSDQIIMACDVHSYGTRHASSMNIYTPKPHTEMLKRALVYDGAIKWNNLSTFIHF